jgi:hypothetical protein
MSKVRIQVEGSWPSGLTKWHIQRVLAYLSEDHLKGLEMIRVIDDCPDDELENVPSYMRGFLYKGEYLRSTKQDPAQIVLFANDIYFGIPKPLLVSPLATLKFARILAHEIGHHVIAKRGHIYQSSEKYKPWQGIRDPETEKMVDRFAAEVVQRMRQHWPYKVGKLLSRLCSTVLYRTGLRAYWTEDYKHAASLLARAHSLNLENEDAGQAYRHAMEKLKTQTPTPLNEAEKEWLMKKYSNKPLNATRKPYFSSKR